MRSRIGFIRAMARLGTGRTAFLAFLVVHTFVANRGWSAPPPLPETETVARAVALFEARRYAEAEPLFDALAESHPARADVHYHRGALALRRGDMARAVTSLETAVGIDPSLARAHHALGDAYGLSAQRASLLARLDWARKSLTAYRRAVELDPDSTVFRLGLLNFYAQAPAVAGGGRDKAYAEAIEIRRRDPVEGGLALCRLYGADNKWKEAFETLDTLLALSPRPPGVLFQQGRLAALSGQRLDEGAAALMEYLKGSPGEADPPLSVAWLRLGNIHEKNSKPDAAREAYRQALQRDPNLKAAREALGRL